MSIYLMLVCFNLFYIYSTKIVFSFVLVRLRRSAIGKENELTFNFNAKHSKPFKKTEMRRDNSKICAKWRTELGKP